MTKNKNNSMAEYSRFEKVHDIKNSKICYGYENNE